MATIDALLEEIFQDKKPVFYREFEGWVRDSRRFSAFAHDYRYKIRSKLRNAGDDESLQDLRAELETAALLLGERRFAVAYETYAALKQRGPDFTVTYKTHTPFNVEVRRLRGGEAAEGEREGGGESRSGKLMAVLCDKVGQMPPSIVNFLWLIAEGEISEEELSGAVAALRRLAEGKEEAYFTRRGFAGAAAFLRQLRRLSGIVLRQAGENVLWLNPMAQHKAPPEIGRVLERLGRG